MFGGTIVPFTPMVCAGPVRYRGHESLRKDLDNLKSALAGTTAIDAFVPAVAPSGVGRNGYYRSDEEYLHAVGAALREEYLAIVDAGFLLQVDDPFLADVFSDPELSRPDQARTAELHVEVINEALRGIPAERVRFHTCYEINEGPRGFSSQACYRTEVHPTVIRVKLQAMAEGARLATKRLWAR
jgi:5-methyltetrahydropteroyltriglutamate--homocysteine methyltransferase